MAELQDTRILALLVHRGLLDADIVRTALANKDPGAFLIESGAISAEQWREWRETEAGTRPKLTRYELGE